MRKILFASGLSIGFLLIGLSVFAEQIGLDNDSGWGAGRILILKAGIALLIISILVMVFRNSLTVLGQHISGAINKFNKINYSTRMIIFSLPVILVVIASYIWFAQPSLKPSDFNYYSSLAIAFKKHQLHLVEEPSPALLALENPYNYGLRKTNGVDFPWDVSLYKNKFYLYWGPAPSLILTIFGISALNNIGDVYIVLVFLFGLYVYLFLFTYSIWLRFGQNLPPWLFGIVILVIGLSAPVTQMLNYSRIYEAAIFGCQFFFIGGCYWAFSSLSGKMPSPYKLFLAGSHWSFALGTRITILPVILFATAITLIYLFKQIRPVTIKSFFMFLAYLCMPLAFAASGLAWYNWIRFNSIFETGIKYQLAIVDYNVFKNSFSIEYLKGNIYYYFFHPIKSQRLFPYFQPIEDLFTNERLAGLVYISPYFLLAGLFFTGFLRQRKTPNTVEADSLQNWLMLTLAGSSLISTLTFLLFFFPTTRYGEDFMPSLLLLATSSLPAGYHFLNKNKITATAYVLFTTLIAISSVIMSTLVALQPYRVKFVLVFIKNFYKFLGFQ